MNPAGNIELTPAANVVSYQLLPDELVVYSDEQKGSDFPVPNKTAIKSVTATSASEADPTTLKTIEVVDGSFKLLDQIQKPSYRFYQFDKGGLGVNFSHLGQAFVGVSLITNLTLLGLSVYDFCETRNPESLMDSAEMLPGVTLETATVLNLGSRLSGALGILASVAPVLLGVGAGMLAISVGFKIKKARRLQALKQRVERFESVNEKDLKSLKFSSQLQNAVLKKLDQQDESTKNLLVKRIKKVRETTILTAITQSITVIAIAILFLFPPAIPFVIVPLLVTAAALSLINTITTHYRARQFGDELSRHLNNGEKVSEERQNSKWVKYGFLIAPEKYLINKGVFGRESTEAAS